MSFHLTIRINLINKPFFLKRDQYIKFGWGKPKLRTHLSIDLPPSSIAIILHFVATSVQMKRCRIIIVVMPTSAKFETWKLIPEIFLVTFFYSYFYKAPRISILMIWYLNTFNKTLSIGIYTGLSVINALKSKCRF